MFPLVSLSVHLLVSMSFYFSTYLFACFYVSESAFCLFFCLLTWCAYHYLSFDFATCSLFSSIITLIFYFFFYLLFGCPTANFGSLSRVQHHSPNVNHCLLSMFDPKVTNCNEIRSQSPIKHLVGFKPGTFPSINKALTHESPISLFTASLSPPFNLFIGGEFTKLSSSSMA